jgi:tripartite-type tricarboxylate transporter receptor subunit TctC
MTDLLGGHIDLFFIGTQIALPLVQEGKLRALAVTGKARLPSLPNVPTAAEAGLPKLDATSWFGVFAPAKTPRPIVDRLTAEIAKIVATPAFQQKAAEQGAAADYMAPEAFGKFVDAESKRWSEIVKTSKIEAD